MSYLRGSKYLTSRLLRFATVVLSLSFPVFGATTPGSVSVAWNRNTETNISGYKIYWGESTRQYTKVQDVGTAIEATLTSLTNGQTYFCAVTAYNTDGQESPFSSEITLTYISEPAAPDTSSRLVLLEAESGQLGSPMAVFTEAGISYVTTSSYNTNGWVQTAFNIPVTDDYHVWCRVRAPASSNDSFGVVMDGAAEETFHVYGAPEPADGIRSSGWIWKKIHIPSAGPRIYALNTGSHTIRFRSREPGAQIDRIVFSSDPNFVPTDALPRSGDALAVTSTPVSLTRDQGQAAVFAVTAAATGPVSYQWKKNGAALPGATSATLVLTSLETAHAGSYSVDLVRGTVSTNVGPAALVVNGTVPEPVFKISRVTVNPDLSVTFNVMGELDSNIVVWASSNLTDWTPIGAQLNETGTITLPDPGASGKTKRFYRLDSESAAPF